MGWVLYPFGGTTVLAMSGASPGGVSILCVLPEHDLVFTAYGNNPGAIMLQDQILRWLLSEHLGVRVPTLINALAEDVDLTPYVGTYRSNQLRVDVSVVDGHPRLHRAANNPGRHADLGHHSVPFAECLCQRGSSPRDPLARQRITLWCEQRFTG
ncbi:hypothetical protein ACFQ1S_25160, partial [Kibdelosporangium lantanae]